MNQEKPQSKDGRGKQQHKEALPDNYIPKPDRAQFLEAFNFLRADLEVARAKLAKSDQDISSQKSSSPSSPEEAKLREEHSEVLKERNLLRDAERKVNAEAEKIEASVKRKLEEIQALRPKNGPRTAKELDARIQQLESSVDSGSLPIVEEQKALREVSALKKQRASFGKAEKVQAEIDEVRAKSAELRKTVDQAALKKVLARKAELEKQLDAFKESHQARRAKLNTAHDARREAQAEVREINRKMTEMRKDFDKKMDEFSAKLKARKQQREEEEKESKVQLAKQKKISEAAAKLDAAREPAFARQIEQAKSLLAFFDPRAVEKDEPTAQAAGSLSKSGKKSSVASALKGPAAPKGQTIAPQQIQQQPPSRKSQKLKQKEVSGPTKMQFDWAIVDAFSTLNIALPTSTDDLEATKEKIREKIAYYSEHNERVTKEKVERAEKDLQQIKDSLKAETEPVKVTETKA